MSRGKKGMVLVPEAPQQARPVSLYDVLERSAAAAYALQRSDGAMPAGHNGPYFDPETPVRNTAHWLITFQKAHEISGQARFRAAADRAARYLLRDEVRPGNASFWHRKNPKKDACNGLVGQAWTIEALVVAAQVLESSAPLRLAEAVFLQHPFDDEAALWHRLEVDGRPLSFDASFNHQLWFAAAGALLAPHATPEVGRRVRRFMARLDAHLTLYRSGLIHHIITATYEGPKRPAKKLLWMLGLPPARYRKLRYKEVGYQTFNLYAFALLRRCLPDHAWWQSRKFGALWQYARSDAFADALDENTYAYPYNPPGFEMAFALEVFAGGAEEAQQHWLATQLLRCFDFEAGLMNRHTPDPATHTARLYEATRLPDLALDLEA